MIKNLFISNPFCSLILYWADCQSERIFCRPPGRDNLFKHTSEHTSTTLSVTGMIISQLNNFILRLFTICGFTNNLKF
jgi:hypothetical protein